MAIKTVPRFSLFEPVSYSAGSIAATTLNTTDDWVAFVFYWPGGDLTKCAFYCSAASGSPIVTAQLFNTDATDATSTPVDTGSAIGSAVDSATLVASTTVTVSGIGQAALAAGTYALRLVFKSGTSCAIGRLYTLSALWATALPYTVIVTNGGAQTKTAGAGNMIALGNGSAFVPVLGCVPPVLHTAATFQDTSNPDEYGLWFTNPFPVPIRICGVVWNSTAATRPNVRVNYYTGSLASPNAAVSATMDRDAVLIAAGGNYLDFSSKQTLAAGASAGIGIRATTTQNHNILFWDFLTGNQALMDMWWGQNATLFTREGDAGALTQTTFRTPMIFPIVDGVDTGVRARYGMGI